MSKSTDVNGVKTVWSKEDRWSGSSSELANFIKWLKDHAEGDIMSYFYLHIIEGRDLLNLIPSTNATAPTYKTSSGNTSTVAVEDDGTERELMSEGTGVTQPNRKWWNKTDRERDPERKRWVTSITEVLSNTQDITQAAKWVNFDDKDSAPLYTDAHVMKMLKKAQK